MKKTREQLEEEFFMTADWDKICKNAGITPMARRQFYVDTTGLTPEQVREAIAKAREQLTPAEKASEMGKDGIYRPKIPLIISAPMIPDKERYPHECPVCKAPAYIGLNSTECSRKNCK